MMATGLRAPEYSFDVEADALCLRCKMVIRGGGHGITARQAKDRARVDLMRAYELHVETDWCEAIETGAGRPDDD